MLTKLQKELRVVATKERAVSNAWFFKTGKGQYGAGDKFLGITVPEIRRAIKKHTDLPLADIKKLLDSRFHEERLAGLLILVSQYKKADQATRQKIFEFYLANVSRVNNWDLVDLSAPHIVGAHLFDASQKMRALLPRLASSANLWERRVAIISTLYFIKQGDYAPTLALARKLLSDKYDLIHKAIGWMLREVGKSDVAVLENFLLEKGRYKKMPRTMLRYAIERFPESKRKKYLLGVL